MRFLGTDLWWPTGPNSAVRQSKGRMDFAAAGGIIVLLGLGAVTAALFAAPPAKAQTWRELCVKDTAVEFRIGSEWWYGTALEPNQGEESCAITNSTYAGSEKIFNMTPDRFRAVGSVPEAEVFPKAPDPRCVPGTPVEVRIGSSWYDGMVVQPHPTDGSCGIRNTSYTGREMLIAAANDSFRIPGAQAAVPQAAPPQDAAPPAPILPEETAEQDAAPPQAMPGAAAPRPRVVDVIATVEEVGSAYAGNTPAARAKYENKTVQLTGTLQRVSDDSVILGDGPFGKAMCTFAQQDREQLLALRPGSAITVVGEESWWGWDWFNLGQCQVVPASASQARSEPPAVPAPDAAPDAVAPDAAAGPPAGRYVCRQYMTTMGYLSLSPDGGYEVSNVEGRYRYHPDTGEVEWLSGSYEDWGWKARYDYRSAASLERPQDEHIIRMTDGQDKLRIDCFLMRS